MADNSGPSVNVNKADEDDSGKVQHARRYSDPEEVASLPVIPKRSGSTRKPGRRGSLSAAPAVPTIQQSVALEHSPVPSGTTTPAGQSAYSQSTGVPVSRAEDSAGTANSGSMPAFAPLTHTASRLSQSSVRTFIDAPASITAIPLLGREVEIKRVKTRDAPAYKDETGADAVLDEKDGTITGGGPGSESDGEEVDVAVAITSQGEITYPDGGRDVSRAV